MEELPLFVFGTLRRGQPNHGYLDGRFERWMPAVLPGFRRGVAAHGFPSIRPEAGASVEGEVFFLNPALSRQTLRDCDELEDLPPGQLAGDFYRRAIVQVTTAEGPFEAWAYVDPATVIDAENRVERDEG